MTPALGAIVTGVDLSEAPSSELLDRLDELLLEHLVLVLRGVQVAPDVHLALGDKWGEPLVHPFLAGIDGYPPIMAVLKEAHEEKPFGGEHWHADITFLNPPASASLLYSVELPPSGGDTLFANQQLAYERLSDGLKETLAGLDGVHVYPGFEEGDTEHTTAVHPVVRTHKDSGRPALFVNPAFVRRFEGWTEEESQPLLNYLYEHQVRPEFQVRVPWELDQLTIWDNRSVLHYAMDDYPNQRRLLHRVTAMERP